MPKKEFVDKRAVKKAKRLKKEREKLHKQAEKEIDVALEQNRVDVENILKPEKEKTE